MMKISEIKAQIENKAKETLAQMLNDESIIIDASYSSDKDAIAVSILKKEEKDEVLIRSIVYTAELDNSKGTYSMQGFVREYHYDYYGVYEVIKEPAVIMDNLYFGVRQVLVMAVSDEESTNESDEQASA